MSQCISDYVLSDCRFCGSNDVYVRESFQDVAVYVICNNCLSRGPDKLAPGFAIYEWNRVMTTIRKAKGRGSNETTTDRS